MFTIVHHLKVIHSILSECVLIRKSPHRFVTPLGLMLHALAVQMDLLCKAMLL